MTTALIPSRALSTIRIDDRLARARPAPRSPISQHQVCLIGAKESYQATYADVCDVPVPEVGYNDKGNVSYQPVAYATFFDHMRDLFCDELNMEVYAEDYALAANGQEVYGLMSWRLPESEHSGLGLAMKTSYNKNIAPTFGIGEYTFVCANGSFSVNGMVKSARQTTNVMNQLREITEDVSSHAVENFRAMAAESATWRECPVNDDLFYTICGLLYGRQVIGSQQFSKAIKYWHACQDGSLHREHGTETLWSAYQAVTASMQRSAPRDSFKGYGGLHHITRAVFNSGGSVNPREIPTLNVEAAIRQA